MAQLALRFVLRVSPQGEVHIYRETDKVSLGQAYEAAKLELEDGEILKVVSISLTLPPDPAKAKDPIPDVVITI